jgi:hypothetical protein
LAGFLLDAVGWGQEQQEAGPSPALLGQALVQLPVVVYVLMGAGRRRWGLRHLGLVPRRPMREALMAGVALLTAVPLVLGVNAAAAIISDVLGYEAPVFGHQMLEVLHRARGGWTVVLIFTSAVVVAPPMEEVLFRGLVQTTLLESLGRGRRWLVVAIAAVVFAAVHAQSAAWQVLPGLLVLGVVLGWLYERTGSLLPSVIVHMGFNGIMVVATLAVSGPPKHDVLVKAMGLGG